MQQHNTYSQIKNTEFKIPRIGLGCAPIANLFNTVTNEQAFNVVNTAFDQGITYFDTAPWYGTGLSEIRLGLALHEKEQEYQITTKVGRSLVPDQDYKNDKVSQDIWKKRIPFKVVFDYTKETVYRQYQESLQRLGKCQVDALIIHDLEPKQHHQDTEIYYKQAFEGENAGINALKELKRNKKIKAFGGAVNGYNDKEYIQRYINEMLKHEADFLMISGTPTLLDQTALEVDNFKDIDVILAAPYCSGILAGSDNFYYYSKPPQEIKAKVEKIKEICKQYDTPMQAAALQYPLQFSNVKSVIPGSRSQKEVIENVQYINFKIKDDFWQELKDSKIIG